MIGSSLTNIDEDEVLNELAEIERMEAQAQAKALAAAMPEVPITPLETGMSSASAYQMAFFDVFSSSCCRTCSYFRQGTAQGRDH